MSTILIVEDNPDIALLYTRALMAHDHIITNSAEEAMITLAERSFDLIILDMHLPEQSGVSVLEYVRSTTKHESTPVFAISADDLMRQICEDIGIDSWMTKPVEIDVLMDTVDRLLG